MLCTTFPIFSRITYRTEKITLTAVRFSMVIVDEIIIDVELERSVSTITVATVDVEPWRSFVFLRSGDITRGGQKISKNCSHPLDAANEKVTRR